ncbi:NUDIX domain-containing protein [Streptomyces sp. GD-15H]|uniref:NUDIX domain-containing protein n=1 Tax=Streptomyces sp. GD-15H TaxID=3129112 RepID=UPI003872D190
MPSPRRPYEQPPRRAHAGHPRAAGGLGRRPHRRPTGPVRDASLPGGRSEPGESPGRTLAREAAEEVAACLGAPVVLGFQRPTLAKAKLPRGLGPHALRQAHAFLLIAAGESVKVVSRPGHTNAAMTLNVYSHLFECAPNGPSQPEA